jgi:hypothetical protein
MNSVSVNGIGVRLVCALAVCLAVAAPAAAQRPTGGPFSGLFKGSPREQPHTLDLQAAGFAGWDDNLLTTGLIGPGAAGVPIVGDPGGTPRGVANGTQASLAYGFRRSGTRSVVNVGAGASVMGFSSSFGSKPLWLQSYTASTGLTTSLTGRTQVSVTGAASYAPYYQYAPFLRSTASEESPAGTDYGFAVDSEWVRTTTVGAALSHQLTKTSTITIGTVRSESVIAGKKSVGDVGSGVVSVNYAHSLTRKLAFRVGYSLGRSHYGNNLTTTDPSTTPPAATGSTETTTAAEPTTVVEPTTAVEPTTTPEESEKAAFTHTLDVGLGYGDGITFRLGRHYVLTLGVGTAISKNGDPKSVALTGKSTAFTVTGNATLSRSLGRTWGASIGYNRGTSYVVGFAQQMVSDSGNAGIGGPIGRRVDVSVGAGASRGQMLFGAGGDGSIVSYMGSARLSYALFHHLGFYAQASYYRFSLPPGLPSFVFVPDLDRRSVMFGLSTWLPLIKQRRTRSGSGMQTAGQP